MFVISRDPLPLSEACLHGLCASLNAPVVSTGDLPPGPARAAIVTYAEDYGDLGLAIGLRALESGDVALYRYREPILDAGDVSGAMDAALGFAEGLGFLFDDDMIDLASGRGRSEALEHWNRLMGEGEVFTAGGVVEPPAPPVAAEITLPGEGIDAPMEDLLAPPEDGVVSGSGTAGESADLLLLDDLMSSAEEIPSGELLLETTGTGPLAQSPTPDSPTLTANGEPPLSKFRSPPPAKQPKRKSRKAVPTRAEAELTVAHGDTVAPEEEPAADAPGPNELGRIPIVRRRNEAGRPGLLARLLSSF